MSRQRCRALSNQEAAAEEETNGDGGPLSSWRRWPSPGLGHLGRRGRVSGQQEQWGSPSFPGKQKKSSRQSHGS
jgi:hypothetical protein